MNSELNTAPGGERGPGKALAICQRGLRPFKRCEPRAPSSSFVSRPLAGAVPPMSCIPSFPQTRFFKAFFPGGKIVQVTFLDVTAHPWGSASKKWSWEAGVSCRGRLHAHVSKKKFPVVSPGGGAQFAAAPLVWPCRSVIAPIRKAMLGGGGTGVKEIGAMTT